MVQRTFLVVLVLFVLVGVGLPTLAQDEFVFGVVLVGPKDDHGWSQAHYEAGQYVEQEIPGARMVVFERLNPADSPEATLLDVVSEMVDQGAKLILTTSDAFEEDTTQVAGNFPDVTFVNVSGDDVLTGQAPANLGNLMGQMEWGKEIAGCAAALMTETGKIGYLGPLINFETRRLAASAYLGARYCYEHYAGGNPADLQFTVTWIGFWFNIPGVTLDPTEEVNSFFDNGADVVISGIDTTEAIVIAPYSRCCRDPARHGRPAGSRCTVRAGPAGCKRGPGRAAGRDRTGTRLWHGLCVEFEQDRSIWFLGIQDNGKARRSAAGVPSARGDRVENGEGVAIS